jgi:hypothetical protein
MKRAQKAKNWSRAKRMRLTKVELLNGRLREKCSSVAGLAYVVLKDGEAAFELVLLGGALALLEEVAARAGG